MSKQNLEMLEEIFKGAKMGMNATKLVMDKTKDTDLKKQADRPIRKLFQNSSKRRRKC